MRVALIVPNRQWARPLEPWRPMAMGLLRHGHEIEVVCPRGGLDLPRRPDVAVLWNGRKGRIAAIRRRLVDRGAGILIAERGFFRRDLHTQLDPAGFNHTAAWASTLDRPAPAGGAERFFRVWGSLPAPQRARSHGAILVLCQLDGDAQLREAAIGRAAQLVACVLAAAPPRATVIVRPHPLSTWTHRLARGGPLDEALADARFCITINSNAGNEAIARGVPVLAIGPALYSRAGVARPATPQTLGDDIAAMLAGWHPDDAAARNYLHHLAARQFDASELAAGDVLEPLLEAAREAVRGNPPTPHPEALP